MMTKKQLRRLYNVLFVVIGLVIAYPVFVSSKSVLNSISYDLQRKYDNNRRDEFYRKKNELIRAGKENEANELIPPWGTIERPVFLTSPPSVYFIHRHSIGLTVLMSSAFYLISYFVVYYLIIAASKLFKWICHYVKGQPAEAS
jgi:hypothetical protein